MNVDARHARLIANLCGFAACLMLLVLAASAFIRIEHNGCTNVAFPATLSMMARVMHRVAASAVGMLLIMISAFVLNGRPVLRSRRALLVMLWVLTVFLAVLGRYTAGGTLPAIVIGNVVAGMALAALFWRLRLSFLPRETWQRPERRVSALSRSARSLAAFQVWIGGWCAGLVAATSCDALSSPRDIMLWPGPLAWKALNPFAIQYGASPALLQATHWLGAVHAASASLLLVLVAQLCLRLRDAGGAMRRNYPALLALLLIQLALGLAMVFGGRFLLAGVLHNIMATLMLIKLVEVDFQLNRH
ncbi:MAG TPA: COX15/CtaA family protein [Noviherbaspirillum sp.]|uniref:COX15/CtaA family protein n=1 Tax=Noviherbaspirillum sp. TaxID=1926288 RepID=UPI002B45B143|nr:COX15/CtaA family protein [Noviherbaspirillum sp.]HJV84273.1 COX15/CtaA family protein [Noviherbaspirillum sp.]